MHFTPRLTRSFVAVAVACCVFGACSDDKSSSTPTAPNVTNVAPGVTSSDATTPGAAATQPAPAGGDVDCTAVQTNLADILVNWQVVIGLSNSPSSEWSGIPIGSLDKFGDQLAVVTAALGSDPNAASALSYMSGANDIVTRGIGGDAAAQADLVAYLGTDVTASIGKQLPISMAYQNLGCK